MHIRQACFVIAAVAWSLSGVYPSAETRSAASIISAAIDAAGGEARLKALRSLRLDTIGHEWALEQSERPEGPWLANYVQRIETRDVAGARLRSQTQVRNWSFAQWSTPSTVIVAGGAAARTDGQRWSPGRTADVVDAADVFAFAPERVLLTAKAAADLRVVPSHPLQGIEQDAVAFTAAGKPATLVLNRWTKLPTLLEVVREDPWGVWGDVTERRWFSYWTLEKGGLWYPRQITVEWNGLPFRDTTVMAMSVDEPLDEAAFDIPAETKQAYAAAAGKPSGVPSLRLDETKAIDLAPGVVQLAGSWNVLLIRQPDGIVVVEAPISAAYTADVLAAAKRRFPDARVKAVVTTSDAWPHIGGVREYVARRVPMYALDLNVPILDRLVKAPRTMSPDTLARAPVTPSWQVVAGRTIIGSGELRIELVPVRGETGERMMLAWMPGLKLLYTSDLVQPLPTGGFFDPVMLTEVLDAVTREKLGTPDRTVGLHSRPTPWSAIVAAIEETRRGTVE